MKIWCLQQQKSHYESQWDTGGEVVIIRFQEDKYVFGNILKVFIVHDSIILLSNILGVDSYNRHIHAHSV